MRQATALFIVFAIVVSSSVVFSARDAHAAPSDESIDDARRARILQLFSASPAAFIENKGQIDDPAVRYAFYGNGANIFHTTRGPVFQVFRRTKSSSSSSSSSNPSPRPPTDYQKRTRAGNSLEDSLSLPLPEDAHRRCERDDNFITHSYSFSATFPGAKKVQPVGHDPQKAKVNYYIGNKADRWRANVPTYSTVVYPELYDGIDLHTYGRRTHLKYEFYVAPGADYSKIIIRYSGIDGLRIDAAGALHVSTPLGELIDDAPYIYQVIGGRKKEVAGRYRLIDEVSYTFDITGEVDASRKLIIDPELVWGTFLGGSDSEDIWDIELDPDGNVVVSGRTHSSDFPTPGGFDHTYGGNIDIFVAKITKDGQLSWATYIGGNHWDRGWGCAVAPAGYIFVAGDTRSTDFPASGGFDSSHNGGIHDAYVLRLTSDGQLVWASYLGGGGIDVAGDIAADADGNAVMTGYTQSSNFPTVNAFDTTRGGSSDGYVAKVSASGQLLWCTYLGGSAWDEAHDIATDADGNSLVMGFTDSSNFPTPGGHDTTYNGGRDAFVAKFSPSGQLLWGTFLGGSGEEDMWYGYGGITADPDGSVLVTSATKSADFPTPGGIDTSLSGVRDVFVAKYSASGQLLWATYVGGSGDEHDGGISASRTGNIYVTGATSSSDFPGERLLGATTGTFILVLGASGQLLESYVIGTKTLDSVVDSEGNLFLGGFATSADVPVPNGFDTSFNGVRDAYIGKIVFGKRYYVDDDAPSDPGPGDPTTSDPAEDGSPEHPFDSIQEALDAASDGETIMVRDGTYTGDGNRDIDFKGKAVHLRSENGPDNCIIDCQGTQAEPHRGFYFNNVEDENSIVDGFTIKNGYADGSTNLERHGGGIVCGISSSPTITNNTITANTADWLGGGIYFNNSSSTVANNTITDNTADHGGGIYCITSPLTITNNTITGNTAGMKGGGIECRSSSPSITNNTITGNTANWFGGGMNCETDSSPRITNNIITGNTATGFGGGGGIRCKSRSSPEITGNTIAGNTAEYDGGGIQCYHDSWPTITNSILWGNSAPEGAEIHLERSSTLTVRYSDVAGGAAAAYVEEGSTLDLDSTNIDADPLFADPDSGDYHLKSQEGRWDPAGAVWVSDDVTSPCINAGDPASDFAKEPLPNGGRINIGAYGNTREASKTYQEPVPDASLIIEGPDQRGEEPALMGEGTFTVDVHAEGIAGFAAVQAVLEFADPLGADDAFRISMHEGNPEFGGQAIVYNEALFGSVFPVYVANVGRPFYRQTAGFMMLSGSADLLDKTWLMSITYDYSIDFGSVGTHTIAANELLTVLAGGGGGILHDAVPGSVTFLKWPIPGDANLDCIINVIDMLVIRDKLNTDVSSGDNWRADVNEDGAIDILDLIFVRGKLHDMCASAARAPKRE